jgi:hypothetical protein
MKCQMILSQNEFFGHSKVHSGHLTFFIPQIHTSFFVPAISTSVLKRKHILIKSPTHVDARQRTSDSNNNQQHTQRNNSNKELDAAATTILKG